MTMAGPEQKLTIPSHSENPDEELGRIRLALSAVFFSGDKGSAVPNEWFAQRRSADQYLTSFQSTTVAWMVCDRILQEPAASSPNDLAQQQQSRFFAAQTLHGKCRADIFQLPSDAQQSLRDSMVSHLQRMIHENKALTLRLAMSISALAVQMEWLTIVSDLLSAPPEARQTELTMLILQTLPEECASDRLLLQAESSRFKMRDQLISSSPAVLNFLHANAQNNAERVFEVLHLWIRYVPVHPQALLETPLLDASVQALRNPQYLEPASDVVVQILRMYPSHHYGNEQLVSRMIPMLSSLPLQEALQSDDEDVLQAYCRVITEMGEAYLSIVLSMDHTEVSRQMVSAILQCSRTSYHEIASITLHFWYRFIMDLETVEPFEWRQDLIDLYTPQIIELLDVCVTSLMPYPNDIDSVPADTIDDLKRHRFYVDETIQDCCRLLGGNLLLNRMNELWDANSQRSWQSMESCMTCLSSMHKFIPSDDPCSIFTKCFQVIPQLPETILPLRQTCCRMIGRFAPWLAAHPQLATPLLPYLAKSLESPECAPSAAVAIRELCEHSTKAFSMADAVTSLYQGIMPGRLDFESELDILIGVCKALSRNIQDSRGSIDPRTVLTQLAHPVGGRFAASLQNAGSRGKSIAEEVQRLAAIVQNLALPNDPSVPHPILDLLGASWGLLEAAVDRFPVDEYLAEMICRFHKYSLRACGPLAYSPNVDRLLSHLVESFRKSHQSPYLYAMSICVAEYGADPAYAERLTGAIAASVDISFSFLHTVEEMTAQPDVVEELFYLVERMVKQCPDPLLRSPLLDSLFQFAAAGVQLEHFGANKGVFKFVDSAITFGLTVKDAPNPESRAALERVMGTRGPALAGALAYAMTGDYPTYNTSLIPEITWKFNLLCPTLLLTWLDAALQGTSLPEGTRKDFVGALNTGLDRDEFSLVVRSFQNACAQRRRRNNGQRH